MGKQNMYDHSIRVPLVMAGPGIPQGKRSEASCYLLDIYPTLCDLIDVPLPDTVEGRSLVPAMQSDDPIRETMYFAYTGLHRCVRDDRFKLVEYVVNGQRTTQFFDIVNDPWEQRNLANDARYADDVARLRGELLRWRDELDDGASPHGMKFWSGYEK